MKRHVLFPQLHSAQVDHTTQIGAFLADLRETLGTREDPAAEKHPNCAAVPGSVECDNAVTPMCETCPWWVRQTEEET